MSGALQAVYQNQRSFGPPPGQQEYTSSGDYSWVAPAGVTSVCVVCVGSGGKFGYYYNGTNEYFNSAGGAALAYTNNITVVPGNSYGVHVASFPTENGQSGDNSSFNSANNFVTPVCKAGGGGGGRQNAAIGGSGGTVLVGTGGDGGRGRAGLNDLAGGGGAGGYAGAGGEGGLAGQVGVAGTGGAAGGGGSGGGGGGVGIYGQSSSGAGGAVGQQGYGGSGGQGGDTSGTAYAGGTYGGGASYAYGPGGGAVRIIWGTGRAFPSTNTGNL